MSDRLTEAFSALKSGSISQALGLVSKLIEKTPDDANAWHFLATIQSLQRRYSYAIPSYDRAIALSPGECRIWYDRALALQKVGRTEEALASIDTALKLNTEFAEALNNRGSILGLLRRPDESIESFERSLRINASHVSARYNLAVALAEQKRFAEALEHFNRAADLAPERADIHNGRAIVLRHLQRAEDALVGFDRAINLNPQSAHLHYNRGISLRDIRRYPDALAAFDKAISISEGIPEFYSARAEILRQLRRFSDALEDYEMAVRLDPSRADYYSNLGAIRLELGDPLKALENFRQAVSLAPASADYAYLCGMALEELKRLSEAIASYENALRLDPSHPLAFQGLAASALHACDWKRVANIESELPKRIEDGNTIFAPFVLLGYGMDALRQLRATERYLAKVLPHVVARPAGLRGTGAKIRLGYVSADFGNHATAQLITGLFECHDRNRFEVIGISFGQNDYSQSRRRLMAAFDEFHDISGKTDEEAAQFISQCKIDICVDLKGHTRGARPAILAHRPAPIQVTYLGYPATIGTCEIDYVIADEIVLPMSDQRYYSEQIMHLPGTYQVNSRRAVGIELPDKRLVGLPPDSFVYCCFNNPWKLTAPVFAIWMRLLTATPNSVLWLIKDNRDACRNLRDAAGRSGVDPSRLVFADRLPQEQHLARQRLADLFLDTLPYNAHTMASDALFVGLPVVTCTGDTFAGRVAASLLYAMEMPELVTTSLQEYEKVAMKLALDAPLLQSIVRKLTHNRERTVAFDTGAFCQNIEAAYLEMWRRRGVTLGINVA